MSTPTSEAESRVMNTYDTSYIRAEHAYRTAQLREQIVGPREARRLRKQRKQRREETTTWES